MEKLALGMILPCLAFMLILLVNYRYHAFKEWVNRVKNRNHTSGYKAVPVSNRQGGLRRKDKID